MKVSVLINSRNRIEPLTRCLISVFAQDYPDFEVIVLDDASDQYHLADLLLARFKADQLFCLRVDTPQGVAQSRNLLMQQAAGDLFCIIDDDAEFADVGCISRLVETLTQYPQAGIAAVKVVDFQNENTDLLVPFSKKWRRQVPNIINTTVCVSYYLGTCHILYRKVIEQCGGYQPNLMFGEEELDLSYRAIEAGFEIIYIPDVVVNHRPQPSVVGSSGSMQRTELYHHVRNRFYLAYRYLPFYYVPGYLLVWLAEYGGRAVKTRLFGDYFAGIVAGVQLLFNLQRTPLNPAAIQYLKNNYGRLWY